jgi:hypothetical protein
MALNFLHLTPVGRLIVGGLLGAVLFSPAISAQDKNLAATDTTYYHGTIGRTLEVQVTITRHGNDLAGTYEYASQRKPIQLRGHNLPSGEFEISELDASGQETAKFIVNDLAGGLNGTWQSGKKKLPVALGKISSAQLEQLHKMWSGSRKIKSLAVSMSFACAVAEDGTFCWGAVPGAPSLPTSGPGMIAHVALPHLLIPADITALAIGDPTSCYVERTALYCWQPHSPALSLMTPTLIPGFEKDVVDVGTNTANFGQIVNGTCALVAGALKCWPGAALDPKTNLTVSDSQVTRIASGMPSCVVKAGEVVCWSAGRDASTQKLELKVAKVDGAGENVQALAAFGAILNTPFACAVDDGGLKCWGDDIGNVLLGRRGKNAFRDLPPAVIPGMEKNVTDVSVANEHVCAIREGKVLCWGSNWYGQMGDGTTGFTSGVEEVPLPAPAIKVATAGTYACTLTSDNHVWCWGDNEFGQTGNVSRDTCQLPNGKMPDTIPSPCNMRPVQVRGLP